MQNFIILTCLVVITIASPKRPEIQQSEWYQFKSTHQRIYKNAEEELKRFGIFNENLQQIKEHNKLYKQGLVTWKMGVNQFADWTHDEFLSFLATTLHLPPKSVGTFVRPKNAQKIPTAVDWRQKGAVTRVKDQGHCGSCWAFSTTGSVEGQNAIKTGKLVALSEQELLDCSDNSGCFGGTLHDSFRYIIENGLTTEDAYPYEADDTVCRIRNKTRTVHIKGYHDIASENETDLQAAVAIIGPVSVLVDSTHWQFYQSGIFDRTCSTSSLNHAVLAVGYDTDDKRQDYWLIKNSWGSRWGEQGYMKLPRHQNKCGVATQASYPLL